MKIIDITRELSDKTAVYEGDPRVRVETYYTVEANGFALSKLSMGSHSGTHIDAPSHVIDGARTVSEIALTKLIGDCYLVDKADCKIPRGITRLLIKDTDETRPLLTEKQAQQLVDAKIRLIGTNVLSVGNDKVHEILLREGCILLESLELSGVCPGKYKLIAMPLKINADGAPLRACLVQETEEVL